MPGRVFVGVIVHENIETDQLLRRRALERLVSTLQAMHGAELVGRNDSVPRDKAMLFMVPVHQYVPFLRAFDDTDNICDEINNWYERVALMDLEAMRTREYYQRCWYPVRRKLLRFFVCCVPPQVIESRLFSKPPFAFMTATLIKTFLAMEMFDERKTIQRLVLLKN